MTAMLLDMNPLGGGVGIFAAVAFFLTFAAVGLIAFKVLKRSVQMSVRILIVLITLAIGIAGTLAIYFAATGPSPRPRPAARPGPQR
ncbi:MAG: hypothetical protein HS105_12240 [Chloracidobacterium sp.]|nr:hypothetical protein [Chloracidobacterium sp.]MCC6825763.1 hypothetical protein [Acidobacteriota bacterium]MCO5332917.1 hypothetical protein [Pyrinomonadaceae bacterium]